MAIVMRKGRPEDFDPTKMLPGEFAVTMGTDRRARKLYICFAPGIVKQLGTYEDFEDQIQDATDAIKQQYLMAFNEILTQIEADKNTAAEEYSYVVNFKNLLDKTYVPDITKGVNAAASSAKAAATSESNAGTYKNSAASSATAAANSAKVAATSESNAGTYKNSAASSATAAANSAKAAATSESNAGTYKNSASSSASTAESAKTAAETYKNNAQTYMNNAKNYMDAAKTAAASITGALKPKGTVAFANLPNINSVESGAMYNISTAFTSNSIFKDGGNITYPAGTNVYKTEDGMWDCLGGELSDYLMKADVDTAVEEAMPDYTASSTLQELVAGESIKSAFGKIKTAIKNVIALVKMMGTTDISKIGNGTVTGAISTQASSISALNSNIVIEHYKFDLVNGEYVGQKDYSFNKSVKKNGYSAIGIVQYSLDGDYSTWMMITQQSLVNDIYHIRIRGYTDFSINSLLFIYVSILYMKNT
jgi:hypothetical protein